MTERPTTSHVYAALHLEKCEAAEHLAAALSEGFCPTHRVPTEPTADGGQRCSACGFTWYPSGMWSAGSWKPAATSPSHDGRSET